MDVRDLALKHALKNAVTHGGKAYLKAVVTAMIAENPDLRKRIKEVMPVIKEVVDYVNSLSPDEQERLLNERFPGALEEVQKREEKKGLPPLPNAEKGKVKTRFAPNPDFYMTLGNARPAILSHEYARMYDGKFVLRFEDTDPRTKRPMPEAYDAIKEDLEWLGIKWDELYTQSLRMEIYYDVLKELIKRGGAYVCTCEPEKWKSFRDAKRPCPHREEPPEVHLERLDKIFAGEYGEGEAVVRIKTDMSHPDPSVRDWVAFRIIDTTKNPHPLTGDKYVLWPTYNFAAGVDDYLMGITHILRAREHKQNTTKQEFLYKHMGWKMPTVIHFGRLKLEGFVLSKSKMRELGLRGDDPRLATIRGLRRRGFAPEAIKEIMIEVGVKKSDASISFANLAAINRKIIDPKAKRVMMVEEPVEVEVRGPKPMKATLPWHPKIPELGQREYVVRPGDVVYLEKKDVVGAKKRGGIRLMELANFKYAGFDEEKGRYVLEYESEGLEDAKKKGYEIVQWVKDPVRALLWRPGESKTCALAEPKLNEVEGWVQIIRKGYAKIDGVDDGVVHLTYLHE